MRMPILGLLMGLLALTGCPSAPGPLGREIVAGVISDIEQGQRNYDILGAGKEVGDYRTLGEWAGTSARLETVIARTELPAELVAMILPDLLPTVKDKDGNKIRDVKTGQWKVIKTVIKADGKLLVPESLEILRRYQARMKAIEVLRVGTRAQVQAGAGWLVRAKRRAHDIDRLFQSIERRATAMDVLRKSVTGGLREGATWFEEEAERQRQRDSNDRIRETNEAAAAAALSKTLGETEGPPESPGGPGR